MSNNSTSKKAQRKTIRMDKKQFVVMMFLTPAFASIVSVLLIMSVFMPLQIPKSSDTSLEVPALGGETVEVTETKEKQTPTDGAETVVTTEVPAINTQIEEKTAADGTKTTTVKTVKNTQNITNTSVANTSNTSNSSKTTSQKTNTTNKTTKTETKKSAKEICEATPETAKTRIVITPLDETLLEMYKETGWLENPYAYYVEYTVNEGATKTYKNNTCGHTDKYDITVYDILTEEELKERGLTIGEFWK